jgi:lipopolysaccharide transport system ATP-binding protein
LDEGVAVGDENFQKKSSDKIEEFFKQRKTVIVVSHWLAYVGKNCQRVIWMEDSKIKMIGGADRVIRMYQRR